MGNWEDVQRFFFLIEDHREELGRCGELQGASIFGHEYEGKRKRKHPRADSGLAAE